MDILIPWRYWWGMRVITSRNGESHHLATLPAFFRKMRGGCIAATETWESRSSSSSGVLWVWGISPYLPLVFVIFPSFWAGSSRARSTAFFVDNVFTLGRVGSISPSFVVIPNLSLGSWRWGSFVFRHFEKLRTRKKERNLGWVLRASSTAGWPRGRLYFENRRKEANEGSAKGLPLFKGKFNTLPFRGTCLYKDFSLLFTDSRIKMKGYNPVFYRIDNLIIPDIIQENQYSDNLKIYPGLKCGFVRGFWFEIQIWFRKLVNSTSIPNSKQNIN